MAKNYKAMLKRELARIVDQRAEDLGFAVAGGWLTFAQAVDAYVGLRIITFESHLELPTRGWRRPRKSKPPSSGPSPASHRVTTPSGRALRPSDRARTGERRWSNAPSGPAVTDAPA